jgi:hypothetical protein
MRVKLNSLYAGPLAVIHPGQEADLPDQEAKSLIDAGYAVRVGGPSIETAEAKPANETAEATPTKRAKR